MRRAVPGGLCFPGSSVWARAAEAPGGPPPAPTSATDRSGGAVRARVRAWFKGRFIPGSFSGGRRRATRLHRPDHSPGPSPQTTPKQRQPPLAWRKPGRPSRVRDHGVPARVQASKHPGPAPTPLNAPPCPPPQVSAVYDVGTGGYEVTTRGLTRGVPLTGGLTKGVCTSTKAPLSPATAETPKPETPQIRCRWPRCPSRPSAAVGRLVGWLFLMGGNPALSCGGDGAGALPGPGVGGGSGAGTPRVWGGGGGLVEPLSLPLRLSLGARGAGGSVSRHAAPERPRSPHAPRRPRAAVREPPRGLGLTRRPKQRNPLRDPILDKPLQV
jgi:hypothetical protein